MCIYNFFRVRIKKMQPSAFLSAFLSVLLLMVGVTCVHAQDDTFTLRQVTSQDSASRLEALLPDAFAWYEATETKLLEQGRLLSKNETSKAMKLGVLHPERVRVVVMRSFPMPTNSVLQSEAKRFGFGSTSEIGRTMGYAILVKPQGAKDPTLITHELVHVAQQDRLGREQFVRQVLTELITVGYAKSSLEKEAYSKQNIKASSPKTN
jgi:hypothetical protein